jgi:hypothetical protein
MGSAGGVLFDPTEVIHPCRFLDVFVNLTEPTTVLVPRRIIDEW